LARIREYNPLNQRISRPDINCNVKFPWRAIIVHIREINSFFNSISELKGAEPFSQNAIDKYLHFLLNESQFNKREKSIKRKINSELSLKDNSLLNTPDIIHNIAQALVRTLIKGVSP
jgi:DNA helicase IV